MASQAQLTELTDGIGKGLPLRWACLAAGLGWQDVTAAIVRVEAWLDSDRSEAEPAVEDQQIAAAFTSGMIGLRRKPSTYLHNRELAGDWDVLRSRDIEGYYPSREREANARQRPGGGSGA